MKYAFILALILALILASPAQAWRSGDLEHINKKMDTTFPDSDIVFIGTLLEVKDRKEATFLIEKGIKGVEDGEKYTAHLGPYMPLSTFTPVGGLFFYSHYPAKEVLPTPPISREFLDKSFPTWFTPEEIQAQWEFEWKAQFIEKSGVALIRSGGRYFPSDAAFIKEKFGYDITFGADKPQKEKSE